MNVHPRNDHRALQFHKHLGDLQHRRQLALAVEVEGELAVQAQQECIEELDKEIQQMLDAIE